MSPYLLQCKMLFADQMIILLQTFQKKASPHLSPSEFLQMWQHITKVKNVIFTPLFFFYLNFLNCRMVYNDVCMTLIQLSKSTPHLEKTRFLRFPTGVLQFTSLSHAGRFLAACPVSLTDKNYIFLMKLFLDNVLLLVPQDQHRIKAHQLDTINNLNMSCLSCLTPLFQNKSLWKRFTRI